ncbi:MAG: hypothetical protein IKT32_07135 [Clostridia bacterium]|nr:hypothetical protein [Clostridia bacterium]
MNTWLLTIFAVILISYLAQMIMPTGKTRNFLIFIISVIGVCAIISPLKNFDLENVDFDFEIEYSQNQKDYELLVYEYRKEYYLSLAKTELNKYGIDILTAEFIFDENTLGKPLKKIKINFHDLVIIGENQHINISSITKQTLSSLFLISEDFVEINETIN